MIFYKIYCAQSQIACFPFDQSFKRKQKIFSGPLNGDPLCPCRLNEINLALWAHAKFHFTPSSDNGRPAL